LKLLDHFNAFAESPSIQAIHKVELGPVNVLTLPQTTQIEPTSIESILTKSEMAYSLSLKAAPRRNEFLRSRWLLRASLNTNAEITRMTDGTHQWPEGLVGSITHKQGFVAITVMDSHSHQGVGIDAELVDKMQLKFAERILVKEENNKLADWSQSLSLTQEEILTIIFSVKEALFKAVFPIGKIMFYFHDACVENIEEGGKIRLRLLSSPSAATPKGTVVEGFFKRIESSGQSLYLTAVAL
jgi:4'-phosphopantetheinyl transferase EntD